MSNRGHIRISRRFWFIAVLTIIGSLMAATLAVPVDAEDVNSTPSEATVDMPPATTPPLPTQIPPTTIPPTATSIPEQPTTAPDPPETDSVEPTAPPATTGPTSEAMAAPSPTPTPPNTDNLFATSGTGPFAMQQASEQAVTFSYLVTTPRTGTTLHAEIRHDDGSLATSWWLQVQAGSSGWVGNGGAIDFGDYATLEAGGTFPVSIVVTAPAELNESQTVTLSLRSSAWNGNSEEPAVADRPVATFTGVPPASDLAALSVVTGGTLDCTQTVPADTDVIDAGEVAEYSCTYGSGPVRLRVNSLTAHWEYRLDAGPWSTVSGAASLTPASGNGGQQVTFVIQLRFTGTAEQVPPGSTGQVVVEVTNPAGNSLSPAATATLGATRATVSAPTAADLDISCAPDPVVASVGGDPVEVACTFTGRTTLGDRVVTLTLLEIDAPVGWTIAGAGTVTNQTLTLSVNQAVGAGTVYAFGYSLTPNSCETQSGDAAVRSRFAFDDSGPIAGPSTSTLAELVATPALLPNIDAAALDFGASIWDGTAYPAVTGTLALTISEPDAAGCASTSPSWSIQVEMGSLHDPATNASIEPDAFTYLGTQSSGAPAWLVPVGVDLPLGSGSTTIAAGNDGIDSGATWNAVVQLDPPADAQPGSYSGTVSVVIINAP